MRMPTPLVGMVIGTLLPVQAAQAPSADEVRDRLAAYLSSYEADISTLVATEVMTQSIDARYNQALRISEPGPRRTLESEVAFVGLPGDAGLMGFRRVVKVDGQTVPTPGASIGELLQTLPPLDVARRLLEESARYNLGTARNTNLPSLPLELLHARHRHRFTDSAAGHESVRGTPTTVLRARETTLPSIIRSVSGGDLPSDVTAWVDAQGRLHRAEVRSHVTGPAGVSERPSVRVQFIWNQELGLLVPAEMREEFWSPAHQSPGKSLARYSDFRRFQTSARVLPPPP